MRAVGFKKLIKDAGLELKVFDLEQMSRLFAVKSGAKGNGALALANGGRSADFDLLDAAGKSAGSVINQLVLAAGSSSKALAVLVSAPWGAGSA